MKADKVVPVKKNEKHTVKIEDLTHEGMGVARIQAIHYLLKMPYPVNK